MLTIKTKSATAAVLLLPALALGAPLAVAEGPLKISPDTTGPAVTAPEPPVAGSNPSLGEIQASPDAELAPSAPAIVLEQAAPADGVSADAQSEAKANPAERDDGVAKQAVAAEDLLGRKVVAADGKPVGQVDAVKADEQGRIQELHVKTGGFFGFGAKMRILTPEVFVETPEAIQLRVASSEINTLPLVEQEAAPKS